MPVYLLGWWADYVDPDNYTWPFAHSSASGGLGIFYDDEQMDDLLEAGRATTPVQGPAREAIYHEIQERWAEESPTIPLLQGKQLAVTRNGIRGVALSPLIAFPLSTIWDARVRATLRPDSGGTLTSDDGDTTLHVPGGAITRTVVLTYTPLSDVQPGGNLRGIGKGFDLTAVYSGTAEAARLQPGYAYTVTTQYDDAELGPAMEDTLRLYGWDADAGAWTQQGMEGTVNVASDVVTAHVDHFSRFAVLGETQRIFLPLVLRSQ
jgi:hypothetical protein